MAFTKIESSDTANKGVMGLPDTPGFTASEMQRRFDEIALEVIVPKHNALIDELEAGTAGESIKVKDANDNDTTLQARLDDIAAGGYTKTEADETFLKIETAEETYLSQASAEETYLSQEDASDTYLTQTDASDTYLSQTSAEDTYLSQSDASDTYLTKTDASSDYLTKTDAASEYLTQDSASGTYLPISAGVADIDASTASTDGQIRLQISRGLTDFPVDASVKGWKEFYSPETGATTDFTDNNTIIPIKEGNHSVTNIPYTNFRDKLKTYFDGIYGKIKNAFRTIKVGSTYIDASGGDTIEFIAGSNITLTPDGTNKTVTIASTGGGGGSSTLADLTDTSISSPTDGQVLKYDSASYKWVNGTGGGGATDLDDLTDVTITSAQNGQALIYDSTASKWKNTTTEKHLTATISSGTTLSFTDSSILSTSILDLYVDSNTPVNYDSVTITSGSGATFTLSEAVTSSTTFLLIVR